ARPADPRRRRLRAQPAEPRHQLARPSARIDRRAVGGRSHRGRRPRARHLAAAGADRLRRSPSRADDRGPGRELMTAAEPGPHAFTASELKAQIETERLGRPFLVYRDEAGEQRLVALGEGAEELWVGRSSSADIRLSWDEEVSALHAQLEIVRDECTLVDEGLSRNGSYVNGERVSGRHRLPDADLLPFRPP